MTALSRSPLALQRDPTQCVVGDPDSDVVLPGLGKGPEFTNPLFFLTSRSLARRLLCFASLHGMSPARALLLIAWNKR